MRRVVVVVVAFLALESVWATPEGRPQVCEELHSVFPERLQRFVTTLKPFVGRVSMVDRVRSWAQGKAPPGQVDSHRHKCDKKLVEALECLLDEKPAHCNSQNFFTTGDLATLVHAGMVLEKEPGWLVHTITEEILTETNTHPTIAQTVEDVSYYAGQMKILTTLKSMLKSPKSFEQLARGQVTAHALAELGALDVHEAKAMFDAAGKTEVSLLEAKKMVKLAPDLEINERQRLFAALDLIISLKLGTLQGAIAGQLSDLRVDGKPVTKTQMEVVLKLAAGQQASPEELADLTGESVDTVKEAMGVNEKNEKEFKAGVYELRNLEEEDEDEDEDSSDQVARFKSKINDILSKVEKATHALREDIASNLDKQLDAIDDSNAAPEVGSEVLEKAKKIAEVAKVPGRAGRAVRTFQSALGITDSNHIVSAAKVVVWGGIYLFLVVTLIIVSVFLNKRDWIDVISGNTDGGAGSSTLLQTSSTHGVLNSLVEYGRSGIQALLARQGLDTAWSMIMWLAVIAFVVAISLRAALWKFFGFRVFYVDDIIDSARRWYRRDDFWSLFPVLVVFVPLCIETVRYFHNPQDSLHLANVYLEVISLVAAFNLGVSLLNSQVNPQAGKVLARYVAMHQRGEVDSENELLTPAEVANALFSRFMREQGSVSGVEECDFDDLLANYAALPTNKHIFAELMETITVTNLCDDLDNTSQRARISQELETFQNMLVKVSLAFGNQRRD